MLLRKYVFFVLLECVSFVLLFGFYICRELGNIIVCDNLDIFKSCWKV